MVKLAPVPGCDSLGKLVDRDGIVTFAEAEGTANYIEENLQLGLGQLGKEFIKEFVGRLGVVRGGKSPKAIGLIGHNTPPGG
jgi:hypothetical protein